MNEILPSYSERLFEFILLSAPRKNGRTTSQTFKVSFVDKNVATKCNRRHGMCQIHINGNFSSLPKRFLPLTDQGTQIFFFILGHHSLKEDLSTDTTFHRCQFSFDTPQIGKAVWSVSKRITSVCFFVNKRTNDKLPFAG